MADFPTPDAVQVALTIGSLAIGWVALSKIVRPFFRKLRHAGRRVGGALDNLGGRAAFVDPATGKTVAAIPPIGERLTSIDTRLDALLNVNARLDNHEHRLGEHDASIAALVASTFERGANAALTAIEKKNANVVDVQEEE